MLHSRHKYSRNKKAIIINDNGFLLQQYELKYLGI